MRSRGLSLAVGFFAGVLLVACTGTAEPFDFATDDLCEWVTDEDVTRVVSEAYTTYGATPIPSDFERSPFADSSSGCWWVSPGSADPDATESLVGLVGIPPEQTDREERDFQRVYEPHPALSEGLGVSGVLEVGDHDDFTPGLEVRLSVEDQNWTLEFWHQVPPAFEGKADAILAIADGLLKELGWVN
jgi:hypothetical protein